MEMVLFFSMEERNMLGNSVGETSMGREHYINQMEKFPIRAFGGEENPMINDLIYLFYRTKYLLILFFIMITSNY